MAYDEQTFDGQFNASTGTDALFRAYVSAVRAALTAAGCVRTSDTGQIDVSTVTKPGAGADAGYEIWRFDDAAQSTDPLFFKITYGGSASNAQPRQKLIVGTGSNGSGTITNASTEVTRDMTSSGSASGKVVASLFDGELALFTFNANSSTNNLIGTILGRARDNEGNPIGSGTHYYRQNQGQHYVRSAGSWTAYNSVDTAASSVIGNKAIFGSHRSLYPQAPVSSVIPAPTTLVAGDQGNADLLHGVSATYRMPSHPAQLSSSIGNVAVRTA